MIANIIHTILAGGLLFILLALMSALGSQSRYNDATAAFLLVLGCFLVLIGGTGEIFVRFA
jgi:hypothetical protein